MPADTCSAEAAAIGAAMFDTIKSTIPYDRDYPARAYDQLIMQAVLNGTLYDRLEYEFHTEKSDAGEYIPIRKRKPSVRYGICRTVVDDSVSLLFSEGHFPTAQCEDKPTAEALQALVRETRLDDVMIDAAIKGSVGSVAVLFRVLKSRVFFDVRASDGALQSQGRDAKGNGIFHCRRRPYRLALVS